MRLKRAMISNKQLEEELLNYYKNFVENEEPSIGEENLASWLIELNFDNLVDACISLRDTYHYWSLDTATGKQKLYRVIQDNSLSYSVVSRMKELDNHSLIRDRDQEIRQTPDYESIAQEEFRLPYINLEDALNKSIIPVDINTITPLMREDWFIREVRVIDGIYYLPLHRIYRELPIEEIKKHLFQEVERLTEKSIRKWTDNPFYK